MDLAGTIGRAIVGIEVPKLPVSVGAHDETPEIDKSSAPVTSKSSSDAKPVDPSQLTVNAGSDAEGEKSDNEESTEKGYDQGAELSREEADKLAQRLKSALSQTTVSFDVSVQEAKEGDLRFRVVNKETGKVVREFPPKHVVDAIQKASHNADGRGLVLDEAA